MNEICHGHPTQNSRSDNHTNQQLPQNRRQTNACTVVPCQGRRQQNQYKIGKKYQEKSSLFTQKVPQSYATSLAQHQSTHHHLLIIL